MNTALDSWAAVRGAAAARAEHIGLPTRALEDWRYVDCAPLARALTDQPARLNAPTSEHGLRLKDLPVGEISALTERWQTCIADATDIGALWSLAHLHDGLRLAIPARAHPEPIRIDLHGNTGCSGQRLVISLAREAEATIVLTQVLGPGRLAVGVEIDLAEGARLTVEEVQNGDAGGQLLSTAWSRLGRDAQLTWTASWQGGALVRARHKVLLLAAGANLDLAGLARVDGERQMHQHLRVEHRCGDTTSRQLVKNVIDGAGKASFDGLVHVAKGADRSDAQQTNHNLLLSAKGRADTRPQLDIHADDVKAAHGATVGRPEEDEIIYLRTRGLDLATARALVQRGFSDEILHRLHHASP